MNLCMIPCSQIINFGSAFFLYFVFLCARVEMKAKQDSRLYAYMIVRKFQRPMRISCVNILWKHMFIRWPKKRNVLACLGIQITHAHIHQREMEIEAHFGSLLVSVGFHYRNNFLFMFSFGPLLFTLRTVRLFETEIIIRFYLR